ncbi:ATP-dependent RNA helicase glh-2-like [Palaemon carinicauda]|uniref:ATP-dependent RNA helicase glh-2-like n=1 Tax=Palaemon carinicauda TaxID=392227 RepID=UPI0035B68B61
MKGLQVLFVCCLTASAFAQGNRGNQGNTRLIGGLLSGLTGGFGGNPGFGGGGFGGNPGFGGGGFGGNPGFGGGGFGGGGLGGFGGASQTCRRWCRTPEGQAYCCESNNEPDTIPFVKPGQCPPVRPQCPPVRSFAPPQTCSNDSKCGGVDKCCYDRCLEEHVCKPPIGTGGFGGFGGGFGGFGR